MIAITPELCYRMEAHLLEDELVEQAKIIDLAPLDAIEPQLVIAISLTDKEAEETPILASAAVKACRRALIAKMADVGGKAVIPKSWASPAPLPTTATGEVDALSLRQSILMAIAASEATKVEVKVESVEEKVFRVVASCLQVSPAELIPSLSFFQNGGDSFTAIQVTGRLMMEGVSLRVPDIVGAQDLAELPSRVISRHDDALPRGPSPMPHVHEVKLAETAPVVSVTPVVA